MFELGLYGILYGIIKLYMVYTKLVKQLVSDSKRDAMATDTLLTITTMERLISGVIYNEMASDAHYKAIYQTAKNQLGSILRLWHPVRRIA